MNNRTFLQVRFREVNRASYVQIYEFRSSLLENIHTIQVGMDSSNEGLSLVRVLFKGCPNQRGQVFSYSQEIESFSF